MEGEPAVREALHQRPDLIILDLMLPDIDVVGYMTKPFDPGKLISAIQEQIAR